MLRQLDDYGFGVRRKPNLEITPRASQTPKAEENPARARAHARGQVTKTKQTPCFERPRPRLRDLKDPMLETSEHSNRGGPPCERNHARENRICTRAFHLVHAIRGALEPSETRQNTAKHETLLLIEFGVCNSGPIAASAGSTAAQSINLYGVYSKRRVGR